MWVEASRWIFQGSLDLPIARRSLSYATYNGSHGSRPDVPFLNHFSSFEAAEKFRGKTSTSWQIHSVSRSNLDQVYLERCIDLAIRGVQSRKGGPFGALIVKDGRILAEAHNEVLALNDPTAHAEVLAIRRACQSLESFQLEGCTLYSSCEPCPMCLGSIYWARPERVVYGASHKDAASVGFDDSFIYEEIRRDPAKRQISFDHIDLESRALEPFHQWNALPDKIAY